ncbi:MAG: response regulator transcription factor [Promicromonosporaceae bacterium]|nr:response regulator transcription factor [Promicromonosporaceae bacterium]
MIRIILADDEQLISEALATMLNWVEDIEVVGVAASGEEAITLAEQTHPDVALLDLQMPGIDGIEAAERLAALEPPVPSVIVTSHALPGALRRALSAGVAGFAPKNIPAATLADIVRQVHAGHPYIDPALAVKTLAIGDNPLSPREREVLAMCIGGDSIAEIAVRIKLSQSTTRNYIASAIGKLNAANRHQAAHLAQSNGWL